MTVLPDGMTISRMCWPMLFLVVIRLIRSATAISDNTQYTRFESCVQGSDSGLEPYTHSASGWSRPVGPYPKHHQHWRCQAISNRGRQVVWRETYAQAIQSGNRHGSAEGAKSVQPDLGIHACRRPEQTGIMPSEKRLVPSCLRQSTKTICRSV